MSAPDLSRMSGQPQHDCKNCGRSTVWFNPGCPHCGFDFWTGRVGGGGYEEVRAKREASR
jgi:hypothetical protein